MANSVRNNVIEFGFMFSSAGDGQDYDEIRYEGYGASGVAIIVETMTDNRNRTASNIRSIFSKYGGNLGETGSVSFMFDRVGLISYPSEVATSDEILEAAIDAGAHDVDSSNDEHRVFCSDVELTSVAKALESYFGDSSSTKLMWRPQTVNKPTFEEVEKLVKLIDALEDDEDVQSVTANFDVSDDILKLL